MPTPRARKIQHYARFLRAEGISDQRLFGYGPMAARRIKSGRDFDDSAYLRIVHDIALLAPASFALRFGAQRRLADMGLVGHAIMSCGDLRQALRIWMTFSDLADEPFRFRSTIGRGIWTIEFNPLPSLSPIVARFLSDEWASSYWHFAKEITALDFEKASVEFRHRRAAGIRYQDYLPNASRFSCGSNRFCMSATALDAPVRSRDDEMLGLLIDHFVAHRPGEVRSGLSEQIRHFLFSSAGAAPTLAAVEDAFGMSRRTINRRLAAEGTTFSRVLSEFRSDYVQALAREGKLSAKQLAHAVGYKNHQSLRRAFTIWTGEPLGQWRTARSAPVAAKR